MSAEDIGKAFVAHYYSMRDSSPASLAGLYSPASTLTFEGKKVEGPAAIIEKLSSIGAVTHNTTGFTVDIQGGPGGSTLLIYVVGHMKIGENPPLHFSQMFQLVATAPGQYYIHNEFFRLIYS